MIGRRNRHAMSFITPPPPPPRASRRDPPSDPTDQRTPGPQCNRSRRKPLTRAVRAGQGLDRDTCCFVLLLANGFCSDLRLHPGYFLKPGADRSTVVTLSRPRPPPHGPQTPTNHPFEPRLAPALAGGQSAYSRWSRVTAVRRAVARQPRRRPEQGLLHGVAVAAAPFPYIGSRPLASFQPAHLRDWVAKLKAAGLSGSHARVIYSNVRSVLNAAVDDKPRTRALPGR